MSILVLFLLAFLGLTRAQTANLTSTDCIDAAGFQKCQDTVTTSIATCLSHADADQSGLEMQDCRCSESVQNYNCYATHCWNRVNECEYQIYIVEYLIGCADAKLPVPYFPTPNKVPDACSCNLGNVYLAIINYIEEGTACSTNVSNAAIPGDASNSVQEIQGCECCVVSGAISSIYDICPNTDPYLIGLFSVAHIETTLDTPFSSCGRYLSEFPCVSDLDFAAVADGSFYSPDDLPASGTAMLSNLAGTVTSPASGAVFTYTNGGDTQVYTITAASFNGTGSGGGGESSPIATTLGKTSTEEVASLGSTVMGSSSSATASPAASTTASKSVGRKIDISVQMLIGGILMAVSHVAL